MLLYVLTFELIPPCILIYSPFSSFIYIYICAYIYVLSRKMQMGKNTESRIVNN